MSIFQRFLKDESGATAVEYTVMAGLAATAVVAGMGYMSTGMTTGLGNVKNVLHNKTTVPTK